MQLFGIYASQYENTEIIHYVAIDAATKSITHSSEPDSAEDGTGDHLRDTVQIEHNGEYFEFPCEDGDLTEQGKLELTNLYEETMLADIAQDPALLKHIA